MALYRQKEEGPEVKVGVRPHANSTVAFRDVSLILLAAHQRHCGYEAESQPPRMSRMT